MARSQVLSSIFGLLYGEYQYDSLGLIANENGTIPRLITEILEEWGLPSTNLRIKNLLNHTSLILQADLVFAMNRTIENEVQNLGFRGRIFNLDQYGANMGLTLRDPQLMSRSRCKYELAKYIKVVGSIFRQEIVTPRHQVVSAIIPKTIRDRPRALKIAIAKKELGAKIIIADLVVPQYDLLSEGLQGMSTYQVNDNLFRIDSLLSQVPGQISFPSHAALNPARTYLSPSWKVLCNQDLDRELALVTPPLHEGKHMIPESLLAAIHATNIELISSID